MRIPGSSVTLLLLFWWGVATQDTQDELQYVIEEELPPQMFIANVFADAGVGDKYESFILEQMQFRFLATPEVGFHIERDTGILRVGNKIDRDQVCPEMDFCEFKLDVVALIPDPLRFLEIIKLRVEITDLNDNVPIFPEAYISHQVLESTLVGTTFVIPTATDPDSSSYGIQSYEIVSNSDKFALEISNKLDGSRELNLILMENLDREVEDYYAMKVIAYDGGSPPKSGSVDVGITVIDTNDHDPIFTNSTYEVNVYENIPPLSNILRVHATDKDTGPYGQVVYGFSSSTQTTYGSLFGIHNSSGDIYVKQTLDYEAGAIYHLTVMARDLGPDSLHADATVVIRVKDINDNAPHITVNTLAATGTNLAEISEDAKIGTFVAHINVADTDSGMNGKFNCSLNDNHFRLQQLYTNEYQILTKAPLDREFRSDYNLALMCEDFGLNPQVSIKHIEVAVVDVNDNAPIFRQSTYTSNVIENNQLGAYIGQVNATDKDWGRNGELVYSLKDELSELFEINSITGIIMAKAVLDHEQVREISLKVVASDRGSPVRTGTSVMTVYVLDVNDEPPMFSQDMYSFGIYENEDPGVEVGVINAVDLDDEPNNIIEFSLIPSKFGENNFAIDRYSGSITTRMSLDRELQSVYHLVVEAYDKGDPMLSSRVKVSVYVADKNDNAPSIIFPNPLNNTALVSSNAPVGNSFSHLQATDKDIGKNGNLSYWLTGGNEERYFRIDPATGYILVNKDLSHMDLESFELEILVKDHGDPQRSAMASLNVVVNKSIIFPYDSTQSLLGGNFTIVVSVAVVSGIVAIILVVAIVAMLRRQDNDSNGDKKYVETLKVLAVPDESKGEAQEFLECKEKCIVESEDGSNYVEPDVTIDIHKGYTSQTSPTYDDIQQHTQLHSYEPTSSVVAPAHAMALEEGSQGGTVSPLTSQSGLPLTHPDLQVHKINRLLKPDPETDSTSSADGSNADSGRGASEEGECLGRSSGSDMTHSISNGTGGSGRSYSGLCNTSELINSNHGNILTSYPTENTKPLSMSKGHVTFAKPLENRGTTIARTEALKHSMDRRAYPGGGAVHYMPVRGVIKDNRDISRRIGQYSTFIDPLTHSSHSSSVIAHGHNVNTTRHDSLRAKHNNHLKSETRTCPERIKTYGRDSYGTITCGNIISTRDYLSDSLSQTKPVQYSHMQSDSARDYVLKLEGTDISNDVMV